jgi:uncharacterized protein (TIGR01244 family)
VNIHGGYRLFASAAALARFGGGGFCFWGVDGAPAVWLAALCRPEYLLLFDVQWLDRARPPFLQSRMDIRRITDTFYAAPQISAEDVAEIAAAGFRHVICNRPDDEVPPSHQSLAISAAASDAGLGFSVHPLTHQTMTPAVIQGNLAAIEAAAGPVLAYCASGTRSTIAWALGMAGKMPTADIIEAAARGGYDLRGLQPTLETLSEQKSSG